MNKVILIGRLTKDPEMRYTSSNVPITNFSIAVDRPYANQNGEKEADFINILVWRKQAENCSKYLFKGSQVAIEGSIQTRNYEGQDGKKVYVTEIVADNVQFLNSKKEAKPKENQEENPYKDMSVKVEADQSIPISDEDLPF